MAAIKIGPAFPPIVFTRPGTYSVEGGRQKTAFSQGTVYFRHGAKKRPGIATTFAPYSNASWKLYARHGSTMSARSSRPPRDRKSRSFHQRFDTPIGQTSGPSRSSTILLRQRTGLSTSIGRIRSVQRKQLPKSESAYQRVSDSTTMISCVFAGAMALTPRGSSFTSQNSDRHNTVSVS